MTEIANLPHARNPDELVTLFSSEIWRFAASQISHREDAEDVVMEVFAAAFRDFSKLDRADNQRHWLLAVARKKVADSHRKRYRRAEQPIEKDTEAEQAIPDASQFATREALAAIPVDQREVLILKYVNGLSTEEVGAIIRRSLAATNSLLQRGRESLRLALQGENL